jgi:AraC-like DNA-binding protein
MGEEMSSRPLPRNLKKALALLDANPARRWTIGALAAACSVAPRTLQRHFKSYLGSGPVQFARNLRLAWARRDLLRASTDESVTEIAMRYGFSHLGRFSTRYLERHGESPSVTLQKRRSAAVSGSSSSAPLVFPSADRPTIAVLPFDSTVPGRVGAFADEVSAALCRLRWLTVTTSMAARYHVRGKVQSDAAGRLRVNAFLLDAQCGRYLWADRWVGELDDLFEFEEQTARRIAQAIQPALHHAEIEHAWRTDPARLNSWELCSLSSRLRS